MPLTAVRAALIAAAGFAAGAWSLSPARSDAQIDRRKAIVQRVFDDVLNRGRYELFAESYDPAFVKHVDNRTYTLEEEIGQARGTRAVASDLVMTVDRMIAEGNFVAVAYTGRGTQDGPFGGIPPTGRRFELPGATVYRFRGDKIVEEWTYYNELDALRQIGAWPPKPQPPGEGPAMREQDPARVRDAVTLRMASFEAAERSLDARKLMDHFSSAGAFYMYDDGVRLDLDAVKDRLQRAFPTLASLDGGFVGLEVHVLGRDAALATARFRETVTTAGGAAVRQHGAASWLWRLQGSEWKIVYGQVDHYPERGTGSAP